MANITWTNVTDHAAELSTVAAAAQTDILAYVNSVVKVSLIDGEAGPKTKLVRIYLAAHFGALNLASSTGVSGAVTSKKEGDVAVTYASATTLAAAPHGSTTYGQMYLTLIGSSALRAPLLL